MQRPVVIVDPRSSGIELAPTFKARGVPSIAVTLQSQDWRGFGSTIQANDFIIVLPNQANLIDLLKPYNPLAIIPGTEEAVLLAELLTAKLTPQYANNPATSIHRMHKAAMQSALASCGVPALHTLDTNSESTVMAWLNEYDLNSTPLIVKPPISSGSDKVFHVPAGGDWKVAFNRVLTEPSPISGERNHTVVVQEQAIGQEFAVGTVSANGRHYLVHLIKYNKSSADDRKTVFDFVEFVPYCPRAHQGLFAYTCKALDALGVRWGAAHTEIILTKQGPRLIETGIRMCGGPTVGFARAASGSSQADKLVEAYLDGDILQTEYVCKQSVVPVFLRSPAEGSLVNIDVFDAVSDLPTLLAQYMWCSKGDFVCKTVDYLTSIGIVALAGERAAVMRDYQTIRQIESRLVVKPVCATLS